MKLYERIKRKDINCIARTDKRRTQKPKKSFRNMCKLKRFERHINQHRENIGTNQGDKRKMKLYSTLTPAQQHIYNIVDALFITYKIPRKEFVTILAMLLNKYKFKVMK